VRRGFLQRGPELVSALEAYENKAIYEHNQAAQVSSSDARTLASDLSKVVGLWDLNDAGQTVMLEGIADIMLKNISPEDPHREDAVNRFISGLHDNRSYSDVATMEPVYTEDLYNRLRIHQCEIFFGGVTGSWCSKTSKIIGKAMNRLNPPSPAHSCLKFFY